MFSRLASTFLKHRLFVGSSVLLCSASLLGTTTTDTSSSSSVKQSKLSSIKKQVDALKLASYIDHTALKQTTTTDDIKKLCDEALKYNFASVCVSPYWVPLCNKLLNESNENNNNIKICTVIGFPLGSNSTYIKCIETAEAILNGATEIDMVININAVKSGDWDYVLNDISCVVKTAFIVNFYLSNKHINSNDINFINELIFNILNNKINNISLLNSINNNNIKVKVILETCLLDNSEIEKCSDICIKGGVQFIKTSTGFSSGGATIKDVKLIKSVIDKNNANDFVGIKAAGGIRDYIKAYDMINAGATRIGATRGVKIIQGLQNEEGTH